MKNKEVNKHVFVGDWYLNESGNKITVLSVVYGKRGRQEAIRSTGRICIRNIR
jgi:hypothetical protein